MKYLLTIFMLCWTIPLHADDWPREVLSSEGTITMYQPQIESYDGNSLRARAAVSILPVNRDETIFGAVWIKCRVLTDRPTRTVRIEEMEVRRIRFPAGTDADTARIASDLEEVIPRFDLTFSLDLLLESIETVQKERENARDIDLNPPKIIIMNRPAVLVRIDGNPIFVRVAGTSLKRVVNTPFFMVQNISTGRLFLHGGDIWFSAKKIAGPWTRTVTPGKSIVDLYEQTKSDDEFYEDSIANDIMWQTGKIPDIVVSTKPAELIATDGPMRLSRIEGTGLLYVSNTPGRLFLEVKTKRYFILISGRWYTAKSLIGSWKYIASEDLPEDFRNIPPGSEIDDVLASIAGTIPAKEAIFDAQIPQMAEVDRAEATSEVEYDGDPQFDPIENTGMEYAVNTSTAVIRFRDRYYNCDRGIWFEGASPFGPWIVCIEIPEIIYTIPPRYPVYNVRYVRVYHYTPDFVYVGYTAGYTGCYIYGRAIVYGTGYNYRPWYKHRYYARPWTWGFSVHYDPWTGWEFGAGWGHPRGWFAHHPKIVYGGWWGPADYHPVYRTARRAVYREGYHPVFRYRGSSVAAATSYYTERNYGMGRMFTLYDNRSSGVRRPAAVERPRYKRGTKKTTPVAPPQPEVRPITRPVTAPPVAQPEPPPARQIEPPKGTRQPEVRPITRPVTPTPVAQPEPTPIKPVEPPKETRQPEVRPITRPVTSPPVVQPEPEPSRPVEPPKETRQPEERPITRPVAAPIAQPEPEPSRPVEPPKETRQPEVRPITMPVAAPIAQPQPQETPKPAEPVETRPSTRENNVYAAPDGNVMRTTPQGWEQRDQNTWKKADETPAQRETVRDSEVRQRATERTSGSSAAPAPQPAPRRTADDNNKKR